MILYQNTFITRCLNKFTFVPADSGYALIRRKARILQVLGRLVSTPSENNENTFKNRYGKYNPNKSTKPKQLSNHGSQIHNGYA